jgi:hypothetical protein
MGLPYGLACDLSSRRQVVPVQLRDGGFALTGVELAPQRRNQRERIDDLHRPFAPSAL